MKTAFTIFIVLVGHFSHGQKWNSIANSRILLADLREFKQDPIFKSNYDYFKKGDSVIVIDSSLKNDFYNLFTSSPNSFDSLFKYAYYKTEIDKGYLGYFDKILLQKIIFKEAVIFTKRDFIREKTQLKWVLTNISWNSFPHLYCINLVLFDIKQGKNHVAKPTFLRVTHEDCIL